MNLFSQDIPEDFESDVPDDPTREDFDRACRALWGDRPLKEVIAATESEVERLEESGEVEGTEAVEVLRRMHLPVLKSALWVSQLWDGLPASHRRQALWMLQEHRGNLDKVGGCLNYMGSVN